MSDFHPPYNEENLANARDDGYQAYIDGLSKSDNPFNNNGEWDLLCAWNQGYDDAGWDD